MFESDTSLLSEGLYGSAKLRKFANVSDVGEKFEKLYLGNFNYLNRSFQCRRRVIPNLAMSKVGKNRGRVYYSRLRTSKLHHHGNPPLLNGKEN